jgi:hypothetical protein
VVVGDTALDAATGGQRWAYPAGGDVRSGIAGAHAPYLSGDRLGFMPWQGRAPAQVARHQYSEENTTPRIPEPVMARMLEAALFYVQTASTDLLAARDELARLRAARAAAGKLPGGQARARVEAFIAARREQGRGIPALPAKMARVKPDAPTAGGVIQAPNAARAGSAPSAGESKAPRWSARARSTSAAATTSSTPWPPPPETSSGHTPPKASSADAECTATTPIAHDHPERQHDRVAHPLQFSGA